MEGFVTAKNAITVFVVLLCSSVVSVVHANDEVLDLFVGNWEATVKTTRPEEAVVTYRETYEWVLGRKFLLGKTRDKSDGFEDVIYATYDEQAKGYPFWIFSSSGSHLTLPAGKWNAKKRTLEFRNPPGFGLDITYRTQVVFADNERRWTVIIKDLMGKVLLEQEGNAVRRSD